jgi:hypothetical protein
MGHALSRSSEVFYDGVGSDDGKSFVELYRMPGTDLTGLFVEGIDGSGGSMTNSVALSGLIPVDGRAASCWSKLETCE